MTPPVADDGAAEDTDPDDEPEEFVCPRCQRGKHERCTDPSCTCCLGNPED